MLHVLWMHQKQNYKHQLYESPLLGEFFLVFSGQDNLLMNEADNQTSPVPASAIFRLREQF